VAAAAAGGPSAPSLATLHRAVNEHLNPGDRAGLRNGEHARREFDVFLRRPPTYRNAAWEGDHVEAPVEVDVDGRLVKPWVTWFIDCATNVVTGTAVTPGPPSRESILAALRSAVSVDEPYGTAGGLPELVRVDRGKDFLSSTVTAPDHGTAVVHVPLPARPLIRAARTFLRSYSADPHQRVFASFSPMHEHIADAAARCGLRLPRNPAELVGIWPLRGCAGPGSTRPYTPTSPTRPAPAGPA